MSLLTCFAGFALVGLLVAAPTSIVEKDDKVLLSLLFLFGVTTVTPESYNNMFVTYKAEHDIVKLVVPLNSLNVAESDQPEKKELHDDVLLFFVEADTHADGSRVDQGLYVLKGRKVKKILDYGRDAAAPADDSKKVFFGAKDGLYVYNYTTNSADKYGPIADSIIAIDMEKSGEIIYILTEDLELYKVTENGEKKEKLDDVVKPKQIVLDNENNLYFVSDDKKLYVRTADGVKQIKGLPEGIGTVNLYKPPLIIDNGAPAIIDNTVYFMYPNGTSVTTDFKFQPKAFPTAIASEATLVQFYAFDKKIYEYNMIALILLSFVEKKV